jgi:hypothetical protein
MVKFCDLVDAPRITSGFAGICTIDEIGLLALVGKLVTAVEDRRMVWTQQPDSISKYNSVKRVVQRLKSA